MSPLPPTGRPQVLRVQLQLQLQLLQLLQYCSCCSCSCCSCHFASLEGRLEIGAERAPTTAHIEPSAEECAECTQEEDAEDAMNSLVKTKVEKITLQSAKANHEIVVNGIAQRRRRVVDDRRRRRALLTCTRGRSSGLGGAISTRSRRHSILGLRFKGGVGMVNVSC